MCLVQGFGNVGAWAAEIYQEQGGIVQAVSDAFGAIYNEKGLDIKALRQHLAEGNMLDAFPEGRLTLRPQAWQSLPLVVVLSSRRWKLKALSVANPPRTLPPMGKKGTYCPRPNRRVSHGVSASEAHVVVAPSKAEPELASFVEQSTWGQGDAVEWFAGEKVDKESILGLPCDVLVPAAIGGVITEENADTLQCKFMVEAANGPTTPGGDRKLREHGIVVLPDIYTNGGARLHGPSRTSLSLKKLT